MRTRKKTPPHVHATSCGTCAVQLDSTGNGTIYDIFGPGGMNVGFCSNAHANLYRLRVRGISGVAK